MAVTIQSLPNELLTMIFRYRALREADDAGHLPIRQIRLVCRRSADVGARLLIPELKIEFTAESLARLRAVSEHPIVARGVRTVDIRTDTVDPTLAKSLGLYIRMKLREFEVFQATAAARGTYARDTTEGAQNEALLDVLLFRHVSLQVLRGRPVPPGAMAQSGHLVAGYLQYCRKVHAFQRLRQSLPGEITDVIARALARFEGLRGLRLDAHLYSEFPWTPCASRADLDRAKRTPRSWGLPWARSIPQQRRRSLFALFDACARHDVTFRSVELGFFAANGFALAAEHDQPADGVRKVCRDLRWLSFNGVAPCAGPRLTPPAAGRPAAETWQSLRNLFEALTHANDRIEGLRINNFQMGCAMAQPSMASWLGPRQRPWANLRSLAMTNCAVDGNEFAKFIEALPRPADPELRRIHVTEDTDT